MKEFTQEMLDTLHRADKELMGTTSYAKYQMEASFKHDVRWNFIGWNLPYRTGKIKTVKGKMYIIIDTPDGQERYAVSEEVKKLLNI